MSSESSTRRRRGGQRYEVIDVASDSERIKLLEAYVQVLDKELGKLHGQFTYMRNNASKFFEKSYSEKEGVSDSELFTPR